jgi:hypothetical protein
MILLPQRRFSTPQLSRRDALRFFGLAGTAALLTPKLFSATEPASTKTPTASLAGSQPGFYRFRIGAFEALQSTTAVSRPPPPSRPSA